MRNIFKPFPGRNVIFVLFVLALWGAPTRAAPGAVEEFVLPEGISAPFSIAVDAAGRVWFAEKVGKTLTVFDPGKKHFQSHAVPAGWGNVGPSIITLGPNGRVWFTVRRWADAVASTNIIGEFRPADGSFVKHVLETPAASGVSRPYLPLIVPEDLKVDRRGIVWFLAPDENRIYRFDPATADLRGYRIPTKHSYPRGMSIDGKGRLWFVEANVNKIGKFDPANAAFREYEIPTPFSGPARTTVDGEGRVWFVEMSANRIGVFYPDMERFDEALIPTSRSLPTAIKADGDGNIWFVEYRGNKIGMFNPTEAEFREFGIPTYNSQPGDMVIDHKRRRVWFSQASTEARRLGMLSIAKVLAAAKGVTAEAAPRRNIAPGAMVYVAVAAGLVVVLALTGMLVISIRKKSAG